MSKYQICFHKENEGEIRPFTDVWFDDPKLAITAVRDIRSFLDVPHDTIIVVNDDQGNMAYQNFVDCGTAKEWTRPGVVVTSHE